MSRFLSPEDPEFAGVMATSLAEVLDAVTGVYSALSRVPLPSDDEQRQAFVDAMKAAFEGIDSARTTLAALVVDG